jgi:hypothetical protein
MPSLAPADLPRETLWIDYGVRLLVIALAAAIGARWLSPVTGDVTSGFTATLVVGVAG